MSQHLIQYFEYKEKDDGLFMKLPGNAMRKKIPQRTASWQCYAKEGNRNGIQRQMSQRKCYKIANRRLWYLYRCKFSLLFEFCTRFLQEEILSIQKYTLWPWQKLRIAMNIFDQLVMLLLKDWTPKSWTRNWFGINSVRKSRKLFNLCSHSFRNLRK